MGRFQKIIGIAGNPANPGNAWTDEKLERIKSLGADTLQLSVAWSSKPANEVLNLEDLDDPATAAEYRRRIGAAHRHGFSALGHFGVPYNPVMSDRPEAASLQCISDPAVIEKYSCRMGKFISEYGADEVMVYNYDQRAWLCSEFGDCPRCGGIPLRERLVPFLEALACAVAGANPEAILWWEPWELSEGQVIAVTERIKPDNFGIIMHSNLGEVYFSNLLDLPSRNIARIAKGRGIPFISEGFFGGSGEDVDGLSHIACPRLVFQQLDSMRRTYGVTGIKEYYGFAVSGFSANEEMLSLFLKTSEPDLDGLLNTLAERYKNPALMLEAWELTAQGLELFPYNASWWLRFIVSDPETRIWTRIKEADWETPAWESGRRAYYMVTDKTNQHPWLLEDVGLRASAAAERFEKASDLLKTVSEKAGQGFFSCRDLSVLAAAVREFGRNIKPY